MSDDIALLERAAFACFDRPIEDSYKRLLFVVLDHVVVSEGGRVSKNHAFTLMKQRIHVERGDFEIAVRVMLTPFKRCSIHKHTRQGKEIVHIHTEESEVWNAWIARVRSEYPELMIWT